MIHDGDSRSDNINYDRYLINNLTSNDNYVQYIVNFTNRYGHAATNYWLTFACKYILITGISRNVSLIL